MARMPATGRLLALAGAVPFLIALLAGQVHAQERLIAVEGRIVNGSATSGDVAGLAVRLHVNGAGSGGPAEATSDAQGRFRFDNLSPQPELPYGVSVTYQDAVYWAEVDLSVVRPPPLVLTVYDASTSDSLVGVASSSLLIAQIDKATETVFALEIVGLRNDSDLAYVPGPDPMSLLRFSLPPGAGGLQVDTGLLGADVLQVDRGFALTASVPPGEHEVMYAYHFPYSGTTATFTKSFLYGAESLRVLAPQGLVGISSEQLGQTDVVSIGDRPYDLLPAADIPRGTRVTVDLTGLPTPSLGDRLGQRIVDTRLELAAPIGLGALMLGVIAFALLRRERMRPRLAAGGEDAHGARARLLVRIADLDRGFKEHRLSEAEYRSERSELIARLAALPNGKQIEPG